ncbi:MAG TPA: hypothetical protein VGK61_07645 [Planctomycetota bacterium]
MTPPRRRRPVLSLLGKVGRSLAYVASLPERAIRSASAAGGGASRLATDTALPRSFRRTNLYGFLIGNFQRFLIEDVGRVKGAYGGLGDRLPKNFLARKTVGDVVEAAGIVALRYSPLWFFALISGVASGSRIFLKRVVRELKKDGALAPDANIGTAEDLLKEVQRASLTTTVPFDAPPLSFRDLGDLRRQLTREYRRLYRTTRKSLPTPEALWKRMMRVRARQAIPFLRLSGAMTLAGARAAGRTTGHLFREKVIRSYAKSIDEVRKEGFGSFFAASARPYLGAMSGAFNPATLTFTERMLTRRKK